MGREAIERFVEELSRNEELRTTCRDEVERATREAVVTVARQHGCDFSEEELVEAWAQHVAQLSDEELDAVAGGGGPLMLPPLRLAPEIFDLGVSGKKAYEP